MVMVAMPMETQVATQAAASEVVVAGGQRGGRDARGEAAARQRGEATLRRGRNGDTKRFHAHACAHAPPMSTAVLAPICTISSYRLCSKFWTDIGMYDWTWLSYLPSWSKSSEALLGEPGSLQKAWPSISSLRARGRTRRGAPLPLVVEGAIAMREKCRSPTRRWPTFSG